jgi:short-subunit dehydrogenase
MPRRSISGLRTIVTGATAGIGYALTLELISRGAQVLSLGRRADRLAELANEVTNPSNFRCLAGDITSREHRLAALELIKQEFGGLDCLINNAGSGALGPFVSADEGRLRQIMEVNFFAPAEFMRESLPLISSGRTPIIVNVASVLAHRAIPNMSEYCASKFALHGLSDSLRAELSQSGIGVLLVCPSTTETEFFDVAIGASRQRLHRWGAMTSATVARHTVRAIAAGRDEVILSLGGGALIWFDRLCPPLANWFVSRFV